MLYVLSLNPIQVIPLQHIEELLTGEQLLCTNPAEKAPSDYLCARHMTAALQDHCLKYDELISISVALSESVYPAIVHWFKYPE